MKKLFAVLAIFMIFALSACTSTEEKSFTFGDTFVLCDFEITIGESITWAKTDVTTYEHHLNDYIKLPLKIKNTTAKPLMFEYISMKYYGTKGYMLVPVTRLTFEDAKDFYTEVPPNEVVETFWYMEYDGDGEYVIEFAFNRDTYKVKLNITK